MKIQVGRMIDDYSEPDLFVVTAASLVDSRSAYTRDMNLNILYKKYPNLAASVRQMVIGENEPLTNGYSPVQFGTLRAYPDFHLLTSPGWPKDRKKKLGIMQTITAAPGMKDDVEVIKKAADLLYERARSKVVYISAGFDLDAAWDAYAYMERTLPAGWCFYTIIPFSWPEVALDEYETFRRQHGIEATFDELFKSLSCYDPNRQAQLNTLLDYDRTRKAGVEPERALAGAWGRRGAIPILPKGVSHVHAA